MILENHKEIILEFNRKDFEEIYFKNYQGNILRDQKIKKPVRNLALSIITLVLLYIYSQVYNDYSLLIISCMLSIVFLFNYFDIALNLLKWKREVNIYLNKAEKYNSSKVILAMNTISIVQDDEETICKWSNYLKAEIFSEYISLLGNINILIPAKSVSSDEYEFLKKFISEKIKE